MEDKVDLNDLPVEVMFKYLLKDYKKLKVYTGQLLAEIDELKDELKRATRPIQNVISLKGIPKTEREEMLFKYYDTIGVGREKKNQHIRINQLIGEVIKLRKQLEEKENGI